MEDQYQSRLPFERWIWHDDNPFHSWESACQTARKWALQNKVPVKIVTPKSTTEKSIQYRLMWLKKWPSEAAFLTEMVHKNREQAARIAQEAPVPKRSKKHDFQEEDYLADWDEAESESDQLWAYDAEQDELIAEWQETMDEYARNDEEGWPYL